MMLCNLTALFQLQKLFRPNVCENRTRRTNLKYADSQRFRLMILEYEINMFKVWLLSEGFRVANCNYIYY
jgi:hypothetical protein